jgi:hypothetical protein
MLVDLYARPLATAKVPDVARISAIRKASEHNVHIPSFALQIVRRARAEPWIVAHVALSQPQVLGLFSSD